jgi:hypothetical protein
MFFNSRLQINEWYTRKYLFLPWTSRCVCIYYMAVITHHETQTFIMFYQIITWLHVLSTKCLKRMTVLIKRNK